MIDRSIWEHKMLGSDTKFRVCIILPQQGGPKNMQQRVLMPKRVARMAGQ